MKWRIPIECLVGAEIEIEAPTLDLAIDAARNLNEFPESPDDERWIEVNCEKDEIRNEYNDGAQDENLHPFFKFDVGDKVFWRVVEGCNWQRGEVQELCVRDSTPCYRIRELDGRKISRYIVAQKNITKETPRAAANIASII